MKTFVQLSLVAVALMSMVACKAKVSSDGGGGFVAPVSTFVNDVDGPALTGAWHSKCVESNWSAGYVIFDLVIKDQNIARGVTHFSDDQCLNQTGQNVQSGVFRFKAKYVGDIYEIEYKFETENGTVIVPGDNISRQGSRLWISDHRIGDGSMPDIALDYVGDVQ